ncbi:hypothetical protein GCM10007094_11680 [Pseudovibrio japonicus]|uniref:Uncharacterized protein n=1 Tax=Pseudovibrio japonicus TaxID=366534 RepID=A0ABQ3E444_9HYPH|nr:hypothetical protein GCM10007094_11680 [Pseudovibrio japonicus]
MTELASYEPSIIDRSFLVGRKIAHSYRIADNIVAFVCDTTFFDKEDRHLIVKFSYSGNVQYHRVSVSDMDKFEKIFNVVRDKCE